MPVPKGGIPVPKRGMPVPKRGIPVPKGGMPVPKRGILVPTCPSDAFLEPLGCWAHVYALVFWKEFCLGTKPVTKLRPTIESDHFFEKKILVGFNPQNPHGAPTSKAFLAFWLIAFIF